MSIPNLNSKNPNNLNPNPYNVLEVHEDPHNQKEDLTISLVKLAYKLNLTQEDLEELAFRLGVVTEMLTPEDLYFYSENKNRSSNENMNNKHRQLNKRFLTSIFSWDREIFHSPAGYRIHPLPDPNYPPHQPYIPNPQEAADLAAIAANNRHLQRNLPPQNPAQNPEEALTTEQRERLEAYQRQFDQVLARQNAQKPPENRPRHDEY
jgi:hypothetical protein